jgi:hypothetical protein
MSPPNSEDLFGDAGGELIQMPDDPGMMEEEPAQMAAPAAAAPLYRKQGFSMYTMMLILSFVFMLIATILFFMDAGKY